jgi:hypothetical protein
MTEVVHPCDGDAVALRPCPPWCTLSGHVDDDGPVYASDGYHHYGPDRAVPTSDQIDGHGPEVVIKTILKSWTCPLDAGPGPALIELQLGTAEQNTDLYAELTPGQARAVAAALIELAGIAESAGPRVQEAR